MGTIIHLTPAQANFKKSRPQYNIKITRDELEDLIRMLFTCLEQASNDDSELEMLILEELRQTLAKRFLTCATKTSMKLTRSQARTLFLWMNQITFFHPLHNTLAASLVDQIYKQIV